MKSHQAKEQNRFRALVLDQIAILKREAREKEQEAQRLADELKKAHRRERDKQRRLARKKAAQADPLEYTLKPVKVRLRRFFDELKEGSGKLVHIEERRHPYFCAAISVASAPEFLLTIGMRGGRIEPGPKFETHKQLLAYLNDEFLGQIARRVAQAQLSGTHVRVDDEPEEQDDDEEVLCGGSYEVAVSEASDQSNYSSSFYCAQCGEQFDLDELVDEDEHIDRELESIGVEPSMLIPEHSPAEDPDDDY